MAEAHGLRYATSSLLDHEVYSALQLGFAPQEHAFGVKVAARHAAPSIVPSGLSLLATAVRCESLVVYFYDGPSDSLDLAAHTGLLDGPEVQARYKRGEGLVGDAYERLRPVLCNDIRADARARARIVSQWADRLPSREFRNVICVPFQGALERRGVFCAINRWDLNSREAVGFTEKDVAALSSVAYALVVPLIALEAMLQTDQITELVSQHTFSADPADLSEAAAKLSVSLANASAAS